MKATRFEFEQRFWLIGVIFGVGFWLYAVDRTNAVVGLLRVIVPAATDRAAQFVFLAGALLVFAAAWLRTWATAYLRTEIVHDAPQHAEALVADGPYRYVRNPLYLANLPLIAGVGFMASRLGLVVMVLGMWLFMYRLILRDEDGLLESQGESYRAYVKAVPRLWPALTPRVAAGTTRPRWAQAVGGEMFTWLIGAAVLTFALTLNFKLSLIVFGVSFAVYFLAVPLIKKRAPRPGSGQAALIIAATALLMSHPRAQQTQRFIYAALPGVGGGNNMSYGGAGILVFDIDHGHKFVKRVAMPTSLPLPPSTNGRPVSPQEAIKGIAAHAGTARLYVSTSLRVAAFDLLTDKLVWEQRYEGRGTDRVAVSPDGKTLYAPVLGQPKWIVADAATGAPIATIDKPGTAHNTLFSDDGSRVYFESQGNTKTMSVVDAKTRTIVKEIGPFGNIVRPFTFNGKQTLLFVNTNELLGFEVADLKTGAVLHHVEVPGVTPGKSPTHGIPSHGIAMTQDETEIWIADNANNYLRIFDATVTPPVMKTSVKVRDEPGWITFGIDGKLAYPSTGDVVDVKTKQIVATLQDENGANAESEKLLEIDFAGGKPSVAGDQFGKGKKR